jgi:antitoxin HigA-1
MMILPNERKPTHPGEMLWEEFLKPLNISQKQLAKHLGWTPAKLSEIIHKKRGVTAEAACALAAAFQVAPEFWLNLQLAWDLWHAKQKPQKAISALN